MSRVCEAEGMVEVEEVEHYASLVRKRERFMDRQFVKGILRQCPPNGSIADIGTGPGQIPILLASARPDLKLHGVDLSTNMLAVACRSADEAGLANRVVFHEADAKALPLEDNTFDMVVSHVMLHHADDPTYALSEMMRILKPGGRLLLKDICRMPDWIIAPTARLLGALAGYTTEETRLYEESIRSAFSLKEIREYTRKLTTLHNARISRTALLFYVIECVKSPAK